MNNIIENLNSTAESWSYIVWHASWQSALLVVVLAGVVLAAKRLPASLRYCVLIVALVKFAVPPFLDFPTGVFSVLPETQLVSVTEGKGKLDTENSESYMPPIFKNENVDRPLSSRYDKSRQELSLPFFDTESESLRDGSDTQPSTVPFTQKHNFEVEPDLVSASEEPAKIAATFATPSETTIPRLTIWSWLMIAHLTGALIIVASVCVSVVRLSCLSSRASEVTDLQLLKTYYRLCNKFGLRRIPRLVESHDITVPISFGCFRPVVALPVGLVLNRRFACIAISHELAHHRRLDPWINWLQNVLLAVWWFNPMIWVLNRNIRNVREDCCDDLLLDQRITDDETYSQSLIEIAKMSSNDFSGHISTAFGMTDHVLSHRIRRIMDRTIVRRSKLSWLSIFLLIGMCFVLLPGLRNVMAVTDNPISIPDSTETLFGDEQKKRAPDDQPSSSLASGSQAESQNSEWSFEQDDEDDNIDKIVTGQVVWSKKPTEGVEILLFRYEYEFDGSRRHVEIGKTVTGSDGEFRLSVKSELTKRSKKGLGFVAIGRDADRSLLGGAAVSIGVRPKQNVIELNSPLQLLKVQPVTVSIVDENDVPIANASVKTIFQCATSFSELKEARRLNRYVESFSMPAKLSKIVKTDAQGKVTIPAVPANGTSTSRVTLPNGAEFDVSMGAKPVKIVLDSSARIKGSVECEKTTFDPETVSIRLDTNSQSSIFDNYLAVFRKKLIVNSGGRFEVPHAMPGAFTTRVECTDDKFFTESRPEFTVANGEQKSLVPIVFRPGIPLTGRVVDADSGDGVAGIYVNMNASKPGQRRGFWGHSSPTDSNGRFVAYVPPATLNISYFLIPPEYLQPRQRELGHLRAFDATTGQPEYKLPDLKLQKGLTIRGTVVRPDGTAVGNVSVWALSRQHRPLHGNSVITKDNGKFEIQGIDPDDYVVFRAFSGDMVTKGGITIDPREATDDIKLMISKEYAFKCKAQFVDFYGKPIPNVKVAIQRNVRFVSRSSGTSGMGSRFGDYVANSDGSFQTPSMTPGDRYHLRVSAEGYAPYISPEVTGEAGEAHNFGTIKLARVGLVVSGQVVDTAGKPVANASVFNSGDAPQRVKTRTDAQGRFALRGLPEGAVFVFVEKQGFRFAGQRLASLDQPLKVELRTLAETPVQQSSSKAPYTYGQRKEICKYMLERLYALPKEQRADINFVLLRYMGKVEPALAMKWVSEPANKSRRDDVTIEIANALIGEDPDEALSMIGQVRSGRYFFFKILQMAERLAESSPDIATKLAADLQFRLESLDPPNKIYCIAQLGNLLLKLGKTEAGNRLVNEAFEAAEQLPSTESESFVKGVTAELLAASDLKRSLNLIDEMKDTQGTSKSRHLGKLAAMIAESNPEKAIEMIKSNDERYAPRVAFRIAKSNRVLAQNIVQFLLDRGEKKYACEAMVAIALACHDDDQEMANRLIDQSFEIYMSHDQDFESWSNFGREAAPAGFTTAIARRIGYADVSTLVMKTLACRRGAKEARSEVYSLKAELTMAKYLALSDRNASRQLLEEIEKRPDLIGGGGYATLDQTDWLMAWCLTDIEKAKTVFDEMLEKEAKKNPVMQQNHLTRIFMVLTLPDEMFYSQMSQGDALWYPGRE